MSLAVSPSQHKALEDEFCSNLKNGNPAFKDSHCSIEFTYDLTTSSPGPLFSTEDQYETGEIGEWLEISNVNEEEEATDLTVIGKCFVDAYNEVFADTTFSLTGLHIEKIIDVDDGDNDEELDGLIAATRKKPTRRVIRGRSGWSGCNLCPRLGQTPVSPSNSRPILFNSHKALEVLFAHKLKATGILDYQNIRGTTVRFISDAMDDPTLAVVK